MGLYPFQEKKIIFKKLARDISYLVNLRQIVNMMMKTKIIKPKTKVIVVTGTPGTGKTTISKLIAKKKNLKYIDVNNIIRKYSLSERYDYKKKCKIIDIKLLNKSLITEIKNFARLKSTRFSGLIFDSHLSHYLPSRYVTLCIVTKCKLKLLKRRLQKRRYGPEKIQENLDSEIFDICYNEAIENDHSVKPINTDNNAIIRKVISTI